MHGTEFRDCVAEGALLGYAAIPFAAAVGAAAAALKGQDVAVGAAVTVSALKAVAPVIAGVGVGLAQALTGEDVSGAEVAGYMVGVLLGSVCAEAVEA